MCKEKEKISLRRNEGGVIRVGRLPHVPEFMVSQAQMKQREAKDEKEKPKVVGSSTQMLEDARRKA